MGKLIFFTDQSRRGSARCRGNDIAERMGMPCDIAEHTVTSNDTVITVKCLIPKMLDIAKKVYIDLVDTRDAIFNNAHGLVANPKANFITMTPTGAKSVRQRHNPAGEVIWIPHTHCNDENLLRPVNREVKNVVYTGIAAGFPMDLWSEFAEKLKAVGMNPVRHENIVMNPKDPARNRKRCQDIYYNADIAVAFRHEEHLSHHGPEMKCPTKLNNAGSFGVPSIAYPEFAFRYNYIMPGGYIAVDSIDSMVEKCIALRDNPKLYSDVAQNALLAAKFAHISNVVTFYERLL